MCIIFKQMKYDTILFFNIFRQETDLHLNLNYYKFV